MVHTAAPIRVDQCQVEYVPANMHGISLVQAVGPLRIHFTNTADKPASLVRFLIDIGGKQVYIHDEGTFSHGADISHVYNVLNGTHLSTAAQPQPTCNVKFVQFADGTTWSG